MIFAYIHTELHLSLKKLLNILFRSVWVLLIVLPLLLGILVVAGYLTGSTGP